MHQLLPKRQIVGIEAWLVISICLMPFTSLKIYYIGPSEIILSLVFFHEIWKRHFCICGLSTFISKRFLIIFIFALIGTIYNIFQALFSAYGLSGSWDGILFDMLSYAFVLVALYAFEMCKTRNDALKADVILRYVVIISFFEMLCFFVASKFMDSLFGMPLLYQGRYFTPLAKNLHHTSMYLLPLSFGAVYLAETQKCEHHFFYYVCAVFFGYLALLTGSTKAEIGVIAGCAVCLFYKLNTYQGQLTLKTKQIALIMTALLFLLTILGSSSLIYRAQIFFVENDGGGARYYLWTNGLTKWWKSPIIGYGFGKHIYNGYIWEDAHSTLMTVLLQAGIIGLVIYVMLWILLIKIATQNGYILAMVVSISVYMIGGDILRRLPCWFFMMISYFAICDQKQQKIVLKGK